MLHDREIERLLQMALESETLAGDFDRRRVERVRVRPVLRIRFHWVAAAIAACVCVLLTRYPAGSHSRGSVGRPAGGKFASNVRVDMCPSPSGLGEAEVRQAAAGGDDATQVLALLRQWSDGCQCLTWDIHEWAAGKTLASIGGARALDIPLDTQGDPPIEQWLVVAAASSRTKLPQSRDDAAELLDCLDQQVAPTQVGWQAPDYSRAVHACLPAEVNIVTKPFCSE